MTKLNEEIVAEVQTRSACLKDLPMVRMVAISLGYTFVELDNNTIVDDNPSLPLGIMGHGPVMSRNIKDIAGVDILIITGSSAAVGDFDEALEAASSARFVGVVGPSAGWLPDPAFRRGVHAVAGTRVTDIPGARSTILEGGGTPHFIQFGRKYTLIP